MSVQQKRQRESRFPASLFALYFVTLILMSGIHMGLVTLINENLHWPTIVQVLIPTVYWGLVAGALTLFTRYKIVKTYDQPMKELAKAAGKVAKGDFSVYIPPLHTSNRHDYLDLMFLDFNKMVAELGSLETMRSDFIANVSHEIKTPLAGIQNYAQLLQRPGLTKEDQETYVSAILSSTRRLSALVTNILKLNKLESQQIVPHYEPYDLSRQLSDCAMSFEPVWEEKDIEFEADIEDRATVYGDASLLELVWNNLLSNAFKFTEPGGSVTLRQTSEEGCVTVSVSDTGCGISEEQLKEIFTPFFTSKSSGTGLGLPVVQNIILAHHGTVSVDSRPGFGTTFEITLPVHPGLSGDPK